MTFDEALQQHKDNLTKNLSQFGEGHRLNRLHKEIDSNAADYEYYFNAGQQSQQAKVEELEKRVDTALKKLDKRRDELWSKWKGQADMQDQGAANAFEEAYWILEQALKGESDD